MTISEFAAAWKDTPDYHYNIATHFQIFLKHYPELYAHRKWIKDNKYGFGEDSFHGVWLQLASELPDGFKFLELGVYKGQSISAIALSAKLLNKSCTTYGLSSFNGIDGTYYEHREGYDKDVLDLFQLFTPENPPVLIKGYTADQEAIAKAAQYAPYDCIYIDADHTYNATIHDLTVYSPTGSVIDKSKSTSG